MIDRQKIRDKISYIKNNVDMLKDLAHTPPALFTNSSIQYHAAVRLLQTSIEAAIDISAHIIAGEALGTPKTYGEIFELLRSAGIIPVDFAEKARAMVRFRNRAVHLYGEMDSAHASLRRFHCPQS